jgi:histidyl-tRNA synthetase
VTNLGAGSLKNKIKKAVKNGAKLGLIVGDDENDLTLKYLQDEKQDEKLDEIAMVKCLKTSF